MQKVKWLFFGYLGLVGLIVVALGMSVAMNRGRDPETLYFIYASNVKTLDPAVIADTTSSSVAGHVYESLYNYDYDAVPYKLVPELAEELPRLSADGLTVTIKVKPGIHYVDPEGQVPGWKKIPGAAVATEGPEVKSGDFVYGLKRVADFHLASQSYSSILQGIVVGIDGWFEYTQKTDPKDVDWNRPVEGLQALDDRTLQIKLLRPNPQLAYQLAQTPATPVSREAVEFYTGVTDSPVKPRGKFQFKAIATGPYMLSQYLPEQRIIFEANPIYRGSSTAHAGDVIKDEDRLPHIKRIQMDYFAEDLPAWALFQQKLLDVNGIPKDSFASAIDQASRELTNEMRDEHIELVKAPDPTVFFFGFNMEDPLVGKNKALRQAMSMAFDRERFIDKMMNGRGVAMKGVAPPGFPTYDPAKKNPYAEFNLEAAKKKLAEAVKFNGGPIPPIKMLLGGTETYFRQMGELTKQMMRDLGVRIDIDYTTWARFQEMVDQRQAQFFSLGWQADYPDEQTFFQLFYSKNAAPGPNATCFHNEQFDRLYEKAIVMQPSPERTEVYRQMEDIALEECPWILNMARINYTLHYDWVENIKSNEYMHGARAHWTLDTALRKKRLAGEN